MKLLVDSLLPWQHTQWELIMQSKRANRMPHALLCSGPEGLGKQIFARRLAQALLCNTPVSDRSSCGVCQGCRLFIAGSHPDYLPIEPSQGSKVIKVDQIRELSAFLNHTSRFGGYKIVLLRPADGMNINAANSLLKTLEEPTAGSLLLLVSAVASRLPATVRSRCQTLVFQQPAIDQAIAWLRPRIGDHADPVLLLSLAGGAPLIAQSFAESERLARRRALFTCYSEVLLAKTDPVRAAELWVKDGLAENLSWLIGWCMDMIRLKIVASPPRLLNPDLRSALRQLAGGLSAQTLFRQLDAAIRLHELSITQVNPQLMIEAFLGDCYGE